MVFCHSARYQYDALYLECYIRMAIWFRGFERWYLVLGGVAVGRGFDMTENVHSCLISGCRDTCRKSVIILAKCCDTIQNYLGWRHSVKLGLTPGYMARISCRRRTQ
jgi:hypothetical protein